MSSSSKNAKFRININLLHPKELQTKFAEKFIGWLISYGRFIVILVEIVVVSAFLARFKYDADLDLLKKKINQDVPYVEGLAPDEALIDQTQSRLSLIDKTYQNANRWQETIVKIASLTPTSIQFSGLALEEKDDNVIFKISATTISNTDLGVFLNNLKSNNNLREINLTNIAFENDQILFTVTGTSLKI